METRDIVWAFSGGAAKWIALAKTAQVFIEKGEKPNVIIGTSSGSLLAPIIAAQYTRPELWATAIKFGETLDVEDMFTSKSHRPFTKKGKPTFRAITRILTGYNHLGVQDISTMYKTVFTEEDFNAFKQSNIKCYAFGVRGRDGSPTRVLLNDAEDIDDLIAMMELSSRITPFVQPAEYDNEKYVDGGFISFCPAMWLFEDHDIGSLKSVYSTEKGNSISNDDNWDKNVLNVTTQMLKISTHWLGVKDAIIEELYCQLYDINYVRFDCPSGFLDHEYETDDEQLIALGNASYEKALEEWNFHFNTPLN